MRARTAALGSALFFLLAPGLVAGYVPWLLTHWRPGPFHSPAGLVAGTLLLLAALPVLVAAFIRFARALGTPSPTHPTPQLVVTGAYRHVRNPMYLAVVAVVWGQALLLGSPDLLAYGAACLALMHLFVTFYEEPTLRRRFGDDYVRYTRAVPRWLPRRRPWHP